MKLAVLSDVHGNVPALRAVLAAIDGETVQIMFLGDVAGYYPFAEECAALLSRRAAMGVLGNHDQEFIDCLAAKRLPSPSYDKLYGGALARSLSETSPQLVDWLRRAPRERRVEVDGIKVGMWHGAPWDPLNGRVYPDFNEWQRFESLPEDVILLGHTHYQMVRRLRNKLIVNPGSVGQARDRRGDACYALLDLTSGDVTQRRVDYDPSAVIEDARRNESGRPNLVNALLR
jgi:putative phosphoesterase